MKKVWIYCRAAINSNNSLTKQFNDIKNYIEKRGWKIVGETKEVESGLDFNRIGLREMLAAAEHNRMDYVVIKDLARIGRNPFTALEYVEKLNGLGVKVFSLENGEIQPDKIIKDDLKNALLKVQ